MTPFLKIATDLVEECLKDSKVTSAVKMHLAGLIAEKLHEQYKAGMLRAADLCKENDDYSQDDWGCGRRSGRLTCMEVIRTEAEKTT